MQGHDEKGEKLISAQIDLVMLHENLSTFSVFQLHINRRQLCVWTIIQYPILFGKWRKISAQVHKLQGVVFPVWKGYLQWFNYNTYPFII